LLQCFITVGRFITPEAGVCNNSVTATRGTLNPEGHPCILYYTLLLENFTMATIVYNDTFPMYLSDYEILNRIQSASTYLSDLESTNDTRCWQYGYMLNLFFTLETESARRGLEV
jgi:hypothetical protein